MTVEALLFDLDDTLVDTFGALIVPLERGAASKMWAEDPSLPATEVITAILLDLHRSHPDNIEVELRRRIPGIDETVLAIRREYLRQVPVENLCLLPQVRELLMCLRSKYHTCVLTAGETGLQEAKILRLKLREVVDDIMIADTGAEQEKEATIAAFLLRYGHTSGSTLVIGNRLDKEIRAGNRLGLPTVWVRRGEGEDLKVGEATGRPDYMIADIIEISRVLDDLSGGR